MRPHPRHARIERERRFLLERLPPAATPVSKRQITDRYLIGASLRLRKQTEDNRTPVFKLTQKIAEPGDGAQQGWITTIYLSEAEFALLERVPARVLRKTRYSLPPFGIDVFQRALEGLVMAEAEFESAAESEALNVPAYIYREVSDDPRFTGGRLAAASADELQDWLTAYGIRLPAPSGTTASARGNTP
jgi:CYTH domain-containing protein